MTNNKSLEDIFFENMRFIIHGIFKQQKDWVKPESELHYTFTADLVGNHLSKYIYDHIEESHTKDLKKLSYHFAIPVEDLEKALRSKD